MFIGACVQMQTVSVTIPGESRHGIDNGMAAVFGIYPVDGGQLSASTPAIFQPAAFGQLVANEAILVIVSEPFLVCEARWLVAAVPRNGPINQSFLCVVFSLLSLARMINMHKLMAIPAQAGLALLAGVLSNQCLRLSECMVIKLLAVSIGKDALAGSALL